MYCTRGIKQNMCPASFHCIGNENLILISMYLFNQFHTTYRLIPLTLIPHSVSFPSSLFTLLIIRPSLLRALHHAFGLRLYLSGILKIFYDLLLFVGPLIVYVLVRIWIL
jgi:hypothetical protein